MAIQQNAQARYALIAGIAALPLMALGCLVPLLAIVGMVAAGAAIFLGFKAKAFAAANQDDGKTESLIGLVLGIVGVVAGLAWIATYGLAMVGLVIAMVANS
jgi:hypothetical protein